MLRKSRKWRRTENGHGHEGLAFRAAGVFAGGIFGNPKELIALAAAKFDGHQEESPRTKDPIGYSIAALSYSVAGFMASANGRNVNASASGRVKMLS